ncbi:MAG: TlpA family protein disulfide reductase [Chthonomonas sp.]|nr:TlpA family protein disulfide reductase [Chthonomonas sp.]
MKKTLLLPLLLFIFGCNDRPREPLAKAEFKLPEIKELPKVEGDGADTLIAVLKKYGSMKSYQSTISWQFVGVGYNGKDQKAESERMFFYASPNKHHVLAMTGSMKFSSTSDGTKQLEHAGSTGKITKPAGKIWLAEGENIRDPQIAGSFLFQLFRGPSGLHEIVEQGSKVTVVPSNKPEVEVIQFKAKGRYGTTELTINKTTKLVQLIRSQFEPLVEQTKELKLEDQLKSVSVTEKIENTRIDAPIADSTFNTTPPRGIVVKDLTKEASDELGVLSEGMKAPDFQLKSLEGNGVSLASLRGQVVLLDFWATWCLPCREALPKTIALHEKYGGKGLAVWSIPEEDGDLVKIFLKEQGFDGLPVLIDPGKKTHAKFKVAALPTYVVIDRQGVITRVFVGAPEIQDLLGSLREAGLPI